jgi:cytochrome c6
MSRRLLRSTAAAVLLAATLLAACGDDGDSGAGDGPPVVEGDIELGAELFVSASPPCATCHTLSDAGATSRIGPNLDEAYAPAFFVAQTMRDGMGAMPSYEGTLTDDEINAVAVYVEANSASGRQATGEDADAEADEDADE